MDNNEKRLLSAITGEKLNAPFFVGVKKVRPGAVIPEFKTEGAAGADICAAEDVCVQPRSHVLVRTGLVFEVPNIRHEVQIRPRSGLALKHGITVLNSPGTIDSDYRGEVGVILYNTTDEMFTVKTGDRIAQAVISKVPPVIFKEVNDVENTTRGAGGFGSTGI